MSIAQRVVAPREFLDLFKRCARIIIEQRLLADRSEDFTFELRDFLARLDNPAASPKVEPDPFDRFLATMYPRDSEMFHPTTALRAEYLAWCRHSGERPLTQPAFYAELEKRTWLRYGRTSVDGKKHNGRRGLRP
jgi:hypothetical protein